MAHPNVSIVILNWNTTNNTLECLKHLLQSTYQDFEAIIVDNGSTEEQFSLLRKHYGSHPKVKIFRNVNNKGFCEGNNIGILNSDPKSKWGLTLNGDTAVGKKWLETLVKAVEKTGAWGGTCSAAKNQNSAIFGATAVTGWGGQFEDKEQFEVFKKTRIVDVLTVSGAWFIFDKHKLGLPFDNDYFMYAEDEQLGKRIWLMGGKVIRVYSDDPEGGADHFGGNVLRKRRRQFANFIGTRNRVLNILTIYRISTIIKLLPLVAASQMAYFFVSPVLIPARIWAFWWLLTSPRLILRKRKELQSVRKVNDSVILYQQTCQMCNEHDIKNKVGQLFIRLVNKLFHVYGIIIGLPTRDVLLRSRRP